MANSFSTKLDDGRTITVEYYFDYPGGELEINSVADENGQQVEGTPAEEERLWREAWQHYHEHEFDFLEP